MHAHVWSGALVRNCVRAVPANEGSPQHRRELITACSMLLLRVVVGVLAPSSMGQHRRSNHAVHAAQHFRCPFRHLRTEL